jgi:hypothetical protein
LTQKHQKVKTSTEISLEAGLRDGDFRKELSSSFVLALPFFQAFLQD